MSDNALLSRYRHHVELFKYYFERMTVYAEKNDIHNLRLSIKKIRTICDLLKKISSKKSGLIVYKDIFRKIFKSAGEIRENQISSELAGSRLGFDSAFKIHLVEMNDLRMIKMMSELKRFDLSLLSRLNQDIERITTELDPEVLYRSAEKDVKRRWRNVTELLEKKFNFKVLHKIRRELKSVSEVLEFLTDTKNNPFLKEFHDAIVPMHKDIGKWHDELVLYEMYRDFKQNGNEKTNRDIKRKRKDLKRKSKKLRKDIGKLAKKYESLKNELNTSL